MLSCSKKMKGFTLVELMVTTSIFVFITALMIVKYGSFNQGTLLTNLAYDVALTIRTAQTYGLSVQGKTGGALPEFQYAYGVNFCSQTSGCDTEGDASVNTNKAIILFADGSNGNASDMLYTPIIYSHDAEWHTIYNIKRGAKIAGFCISDGCSIPTTGIYRADISFLRPNPDARICKNEEIACNLTYLKIFVQSADGSRRSVTVRQTGQVSIDD